MRALIQRVCSSSVCSEGVLSGQIGQGFCILLGVKDGDTEEDVRYLVRKTANLRIFNDEAGKLNRSVKDVGGSILVVSQFTLYADCSHGNRPGFSLAAAPDVANPLYELYVQLLREEGIPVETGVFQTDMVLQIENDGPVTILLESPVR